VPIEDEPLGLLFEFTFVLLLTLLLLLDEPLGGVVFGLALDWLGIESCRDDVPMLVPGLALVFGLTFGLALTPAPDPGDVLPVDVDDLLPEVACAPASAGTAAIKTASARPVKRWEDFMSHPSFAGRWQQVTRH
jgi:hypothetical protein